MAESPAGSEISVDRGPAVLARLPHSRRLRRTTRLVGIPGTIALRKVEAEAATAALRRLAAVVDRMAVAAARDLTAETTADSHV